MENAPYLIEGGDRRTSNLVRGWSTMTGITDVRWPHSLKVKVIRSGRQSDTCLPITRPRKVTKTHQNWQASCPCHCWHSAPVPRSEVKVTRPLNAVTQNQPYLRNGKAYELQTWYTDGVWWPSSPTCEVTAHTRYGTWPALLPWAVTSKLKALAGCSSHYLQGAGAYIVAPALQATQLVWRWNNSDVA